MAELIRHWAIGPARATRLPPPYPHRTMAEVLAEEKQLREHRAALFPTRTKEPPDGAPRSPTLPPT